MAPGWASFGRKTPAGSCAAGRPIASWLHTPRLPASGADPCRWDHPKQALQWASGGTGKRMVCVCVVRTGERMGCVCWERWGMHKHVSQVAGVQAREPGRRGTSEEVKKRSLSDFAPLPLSRSVMTASPTQLAAHPQQASIPESLNPKP